MTAVRTGGAGILPAIRIPQESQEPPTRWDCNSGGPMTRTRTEHLRATVLGQRAGLRCPKRRYVGLAFQPETDPVVRMETVLESLGFRSVGEARETLHDRLPAEILVAMPSVTPPTLSGDVATLHTALTDILTEALVLGLCTANLYDPTRPLLWTRTSLTRRLDLFALGGFYAAD